MTFNPVLTFSFFFLKKAATVCVLQDMFGHGKMAFDELYSCASGARRAVHEWNVYGKAFTIGPPRGKLIF